METSAASNIASAKTPTTNRLADPPELPIRRLVQPAANTIATSINGDSSSSAVLTPIRGTIQRVRTVPNAKPVPNTNAKYAIPAFKFC